MNKNVSETGSDSGGLTLGVWLWGSNSGGLTLGVWLWGLQGAGPDPEEGGHEEGPDPGLWLCVGPRGGVPDPGPRDPGHRG